MKIQLIINHFKKLIFNYYYKWSFLILFEINILNFGKYLENYEKSSLRSNSN